MKAQFELTLVCRSESKIVNAKGETMWDCTSIDTVMDSNLTGLLGQFLIVLASVHKRIVKDIKTELQVIDDDIPF
jgi:hypothetical protein